MGILIACVYHQMTGLFNGYRKDVKEYFLDKVALEKLNEDDETRSKDSLMNLFLGYASLGCFLVGIALGVLGLLIGK